MCLIYNNINYRRNVVGFEVVANIRTPLFCFHAVHAVTTRGAACLLWLERGGKMAVHWKNSPDKT